MTTSQDGTRPYVCQRGTDQITVVDTVKHTLKSVIKVGQGPQALALTPAGSRLWVLSTDDDRADEIDTATDESERTDVSLGDQPTGIAITLDGRTAYISISATNAIQLLPLT